MSFPKLMAILVACAVALLLVSLLIAYVCGVRYITSENILLHEASELFSKYTVKMRMLFKITRNADMSIDGEDAANASLRFPHTLRQRRSTAPRQR